MVPLTVKLLGRNNRLSRGIGQSQRRGRRQRHVTAGFNASREGMGLVYGDLLTFGLAAL